MAEEAKVVAPGEGLDGGKKPEPGTSKPEGNGGEPAKPKEETVGEALNVPAAKEETVPLATFLETKNLNKKLIKDMETLQKSIEQGNSPKETAIDLKALAEKHNVDPDFLRDFAEAVRAESGKEVDSKVAERLKPITERERAQEIDTRFNAHFSKVIEQLPEYKDVVDKETIKALSLLPENAGKTLTQIIEASYGRLAQGKRNIDSGSTRAGKTDHTEVDVARASKDPEYFKEVMADPVLKKKYNEGIEKRLHL